MRIAVIQFPGTTCTRETSLAILRTGMIPKLFLWNDDLTNLQDCAGYILVGGFSYEDRSRAGILAAQHPIMDVLKEQTEEGKPLLGICNGAQILVESGMVPGLKEYPLAMALTENKHSGFYNVWTHIRMHQQTQGNVFTRLMNKDQSVRLPIAHAEVRFQLPASLWHDMQQQGVCSLQYCDEQGSVHDSFPTNPNGSAYNLAALSNLSGNVMAIMPHPERSKEGDILFQSMKNYIQDKAKKSFPFQQLNGKQTVKEPYHVYECPIHAKEVIIRPLITDHHARALETILHNKGFKASLKRYIHWEIHCEQTTLTELIASNSLFNPNKEERVQRLDQDHTAFLIRTKENLLGQQKKHYVVHHLEIKDMHELRQGILWQILCTPQEKKALIQYLLHTHLLFNPYASTAALY